MSYPTPLKETVHLTCPGCWSNTLSQTLSPPAGYKLAGLAWFQCTDTSCLWVGSSADLRLPTVEGEILACMRQDQQRGEPGSSGNGNTRKKPLKWVKGESSADWDNGLSTKTEQVSQAKSKGIRWGKWVLWVTPQEWELLLRIAGGNYPAGLRPHVLRVLGGEPEDVTRVRDAFSMLALELFSVSA